MSGPVTGRPLALTIIPILGLAYFTAFIVVVAVTICRFRAFRPRSATLCERLIELGNS